MMNYRERKLQVYIFGLTFSLLLFSILGYHTYITYNDAIYDGKQMINSHLQLIEMGIRSTIQSVDVQLQDIINQIQNSKKDLKAVSNEDLKNYRNFLNSRVQIEFRLTDKAGDVIASSDNIEKINIADREFYSVLRQTSKNEIIISAPVRSKLRQKYGDWLITMARRISSKDGKFMGIVYARMDVRLFENFAKLIDSSPMSLFAITTGVPPHFAYRNIRHDDFVGKDFTYHKDLTPVVTKEVPRGIYETISVNDGIRRLTGISYLKGLDIFLIIGVDYSELTSAWRSQNYIYVIFGLLILFLALYASRSIVMGQKTISEQQSKLAAASKLVALGEMSAGLAHEINNPLAIITGSVDQISGKSYSPEKFAEKLNQIKKASDRITKIVRGLSKFSRSSGQKMYTPLNLAKVVADALVLTGPKALQSNIPIEYNPRSSSEIFGDEVEIEQIVINLVNNAIDAIKNNATKWIKVDLYDEETEVVLSVTDSGPGISQKVLPNLFIPFFTTKPPGEGTGLGLSIVKGIVEEHKARVYVNEYSPHTCFVVRFNRHGATHATN